MATVVKGEQRASEGDNRVESASILSFWRQEAEGINFWSGIGEKVVEKSKKFGVWVANAERFPNSFKYIVEGINWTWNSIEKKGNDIK